MVELGTHKARHLRKVLRLPDGARLTYTDGAGILGTGSLRRDTLVRGDEIAVDRPSSRRVAVAPPRSMGRARFVVEKLAELGVRELLWLDTERGVGPPPKPAKCEAWSVAALEQSGGAWSLAINRCELNGLSDIVLADRKGGGWPPRDLTPDTVIAVGPEGGFTDRERKGRRLVSLGDTGLRVETAAVVAAVLAR